MVGGQPAPRRPSAFDRVARLLALLALVVILSVIYWVFIHLVGPMGQAGVLALLTLLAVNLSSRLYRLRQRVDALQERLAAPATEPQK
jgi:hypothetical protein